MRSLSSFTPAPQCKTCAGTGDGANAYDSCPACRGRGRDSTPEERKTDKASDEARLDRLLRSTALVACRLGVGCGAHYRSIKIDMADGRLLFMTYELHTNGAETHHG